MLPRPTFKHLHHHFWGKNSFYSLYNCIFFSFWDSFYKHDLSCYTCFTVELLLSQIHLIIRHFNILLSVGNSLRKMSFNRTNWSLSKEGKDCNIKNELLHFYLYFTANNLRNDAFISYEIRVTTSRYNIFKLKTFWNIKIPEV